MVRFLASTKLAIALCLVLAVLGIAGSLLYYGNTAFERQQGAFHLFRSPLFLVPSGLLLLNILVCAGSRLPSMRASSGKTWTFAAMHLGLVLMGAGLVGDGLFGFVGTRYFFVGVPAADYFNWRTGRTETLPFTVEALSSETRYHPRNLQIGVKDGQGNKVGLYTAREGVPFTVPGKGLTVTPRSFDPETKTLLLDATLGGTTLSGLRAGSQSPALAGEYAIVPVAFADPEPSDYVARVRFSDPGGTARETVLRINEPARRGGVNFCITTLGEDPYRNPYVGLQITREPGEPVFWVGGILFGAALIGHLFLKCPGAAPLRIAVSLLLLPAASPVAARAAGSAIQEDTTWEGEVRVTAPVSVEKGATLRIAPGTTVLLSGEDHDRDGCREGYLQVFGTLLVEGEKENPVVFRRLDPRRPWEEVYLQEATGRIRFAVFEGATWGLHVHGGDVTVENSLFRDSEGGVRTRGTGMSFARCTFRGNGIGLRFWDGGPRVTGCLLEYNGTGLFYRDGAGGGSVRESVLRENREWNLKVGDWVAGDLDASGNWWESPRGEGPVPGYRDFRERDAPGTITLLPARSGPPAAYGADILR